MRVEALLCLVVFTVSAFGAWHEEIRSAEGWTEVTATREGLVGETTASGLVIQADDVFVALPDRSALGRRVAVKHGNLVVVCTVEDVGPHSICDPYWQDGSRPLAESGKRAPTEWGEAKNCAGIDLSDGLWDLFEIPRGQGITTVQWKFLSEVPHE